MRAAYQGSTSGGARNAPSAAASRKVPRSSATRCGFRPSRTSALSRTRERGAGRMAVSSASATCAAYAETPQGSCRRCMAST